MNLVFRSELPSAYRQQIEQLVFFNDHQSEVQEAILEALESYGTPQITDGSDGLRVTLSRCPQAQCLFALMPYGEKLDLVGVLVYLRRSLADLLVVHIAVARCAQESPASIRHVAAAMIRAIRRIAQRLRGVQRLTVLYGRGRQLLLHQTE